MHWVKHKIKTFSDIISILIEKVCFPQSWNYMLQEKNAFLVRKDLNIVFNCCQNGKRQKDILVTYKQIENRNRYKKI